MKNYLKPNLHAVVLVYALASVLMLTTTHAQTAPPKMKMTTDIPASITTPDSVETPIGTLTFFDGFPDDMTTELLYNNLDFMRGVQAFLRLFPQPRNMEAWTAT
jgi:hypothetical protein